jgi:hypothetical protein
MERAKLVFNCGSRSSSWLVTPALYVYKDSGWLRVTQEDSWWLMITQDDSRWLKVTQNDSMWLSVTQGDSERLRVTQGDSGWLRSYNGSARHFLPVTFFIWFKYLFNSSISFLGAFANWRKATICFVTCIRQSVHLCVRPHGTTRLPLDGFSWNLMFKYFSKTSVEKI